MSNFLAVATVTFTLSQLIQCTITNDVSCAGVTMARPDNGTGLPATGVNIFLYQVMPNATWRNEDLPSRRAGGELVQRPRTAIDLHYLFSFYGDETQLEPQRLLGSVIRTLHSQPVLTRKKVYEAVTCGPASLNTSNLYDDIETVKFTPLPLSLEELSKLWSCFFQTKYVLSVAYIGSPVLIESDEAPQTALPVRVPPNVYASVVRP